MSVTHFEFNFFVLTQGAHSGTSVPGQTSTLVLRVDMWSGAEYSSCTENNVCSADVEYNVGCQLGPGGW